MVQPESVIHSMIQFTDGSIMAELGTPDMRLPIQYALWGRTQVSGRRTAGISPRLGSITFENPDMETFKGLPLAMEASGRGGSMPTVFNAAMKRRLPCFYREKFVFWGYLYDY